MAPITVSWQVVNLLGLCIDGARMPPGGRADIPPSKGDIVSFHHRPDLPGFYKVVRRIWPHPVRDMNADAPDQIVILHIRKLRR